MAGFTTRKMSSMRTAKIIVSVGAAVLAAVAIGAIAAVSSMTITRPAPEVRFDALAGDSFTTSELRGKVVVVNFWATWCPDCIKEMPKLVDTHRRFAGREFETVAVAVSKDRREDVVRFNAARALPFRMVFDQSGEVGREFGNVRITPTTVVIDKKGKILRRYVGEPNWSELQGLIERELRS